MNSNENGQLNVLMNVNILKLLHQRNRQWRYYTSREQWLITKFCKKFKVNSMLTISYAGALSDWGHVCTALPRYSWTARNRIFDNTLQDIILHPSFNSFTWYLTRKKVCKKQFVLEGILKLVYLFLLKNIFYNTKISLFANTIMLFIYVIIIKYKR